MRPGGNLKRNAPAICFGILSVPANLALKIDVSPLTAHLSCFSRNGVLDVVIARILCMIANARALLMIERGCLALFVFPPSPHADRDT